jgi:hypothetical protein
MNHCRSARCGNLFLVSFAMCLSVPPAVYQSRKGRTPGSSPVAFTLSNFVQRNFCFHCHPFLASVSIYAWRDEPEHNNPDFPAMQV